MPAESFGIAEAPNQCDGGAMPSGQNQTNKKNAKIVKIGVDTISESAYYCLCAYQSTNHQEFTS